MPTVTKIVRQKRDKSRVSVYIDEEFAFGIDENQLFSLHIQVGEELNSERLDELEQGALLSSARNTAQRYLGRSMRTTQEVRNRLKEKEFPAATIQSVIEWLSGYGFLNDEEYARAYIRTRLNLKPAGRYKLRQDLLKKGVSAAIADSALSEYVDDNQNFETAVRLAQTYVSRNSHVDPVKLKRRLAGFLQRRGFRAHEVFRAIDETLKSDGSDI